MIPVGTSARPARSRSTSPVISDLNLDYCWWSFRPEARSDGVQSIEAPSRRRRVGRTTLRFPVELIERFPWVKYIIVGFAALSVGWFPWMLRSTKQAMGGRIDLRSVLTPWQKQASLAEQVELACTTPSTGSTLRRLAALCLESDLTMARRCFHQLELRGLAEEQDRCAHAALLARLHDFTGARAVLGGKPAPAQSLSPLMRSTWIKLWTESGDFISAAGALESMEKCGMPEADLALDTARAAFTAKAPSDVVSRLEARAIAILQAALLAGAEENLGLRIEQLLTLPLESKEQRQQAAALIGRLTKPTVEQRLGLVRLNFPSQLNATQKEALHHALRQTLTACGALSVQEKAGVANFFIQHDEQVLVLELISRLEATTDRTLFNRRIAAVLSLGDWREAGRMAASPGALPVPWARTLMQTAASLQQNGEARLTVESLMSSSITEALVEKRWACAYTTAKMALDHNLPTMATRAFEAALRLAPEKAEMLRMITSAARQQRSPVNIVRLAAVDSLRDNEDPEIQLQLAYLNALVGSQTDAPVSESPESIFVRAFQQFQKGELQQAVDILVPLPHHRWHQGQAAVIASILAAGGQLNASKALLDQIDLQQLFAEEREIVEPWMTGQQLGLGISNLASDGGTETRDLR